MYRALFVVALFGINASAESAVAEVAQTEITQSSQPQAPIEFALDADPNQASGSTGFTLFVPNGQRQLAGWRRTLLEVVDGQNVIVHVQLESTTDEAGDGRLIEFVLANELIRGATLHLIAPVGESDSSMWYSILLSTYMTSLSATAEAPTAVHAGSWRVEFTNQVVESCDIQSDGTVWVEEPHRASAGLVTTVNSPFVLTFEDNRVERWTPIEEMMLVEHWFPADDFPHAAPVYGIARTKKLSFQAVPAQPGADLSQEIEELQTQFEKAEAGALRAQVRLLTYLSAFVDGPEFERSTAAEARRLAMQLAPKQKFSHIVWDVLIKTDALYDGMPLNEAEAMVGPATSRSEKRVDWYCNPLNRHVAPFLSATLTADGKLAEWATGKR